MPKIMFFDIDGTLMEDSASHFVPESTVKALQLARKAGNLLYVNTGRPLVNVDADVRKHRPVDVNILEFLKNFTHACVTGIQNKIVNSV